MSILIGLARDTPSTSSAAALEAVLFAALAVLEALLEEAVLVVEAAVLEALAEAVVLEVLFALDCPPQPTVSTMVAQRSAAIKVLFVFIFFPPFF